MHENLAYFVIVRSSVGVEGNVFVGGDGTQLPSDAGVHGAIVYGRRGARMAQDGAEPVL